MNRLLKPLAMVIAVGLLAIVAVKFLPIRAVATGMLTRAVSAQTGQRLDIDGDLYMTLWPAPVVMAERVELIATGATLPWLQAARVEVQLSVNALWQGRIEATAIRLSEARIHLIQSGKTNGGRLAAGRADAEPAGIPPKPNAGPKVPPVQPAGTAVSVESVSNNETHWLATVPREGIELIDASLTWEDPTAGRRLVLSDIDAKAAVQGNQLRIEHRVGNLYGGHLAGTLDVVPNGATPRLILEAAARDVQLEGMLADLYGHEALTGRTDLVMSLNSVGTDLQTMIGNLDGKIALHLRDGALIGVDPEAIIEAAMARLRGRAVSAATVQPDPQVVLNELDASAELRLGVLHSDDLRVHGPWLDATGSGSLDLADGQLDWRLVSILKKPPKGRGLKELEGLPIPISLTGTLSEPVWRVDVVAALAEAARRGRAGQGDSLLDKLERRTGVKGLGGMLRGLLGH